MSPNTFDIVTHRGSYLSGENSLESISDAIAKGFGFIEFDVRLTKDNEPVVMHDRTLKRTTGVAGSVRDFTFEQLQNISLTSGGKIPHLQDVIDLCKGRIVMWMHLKMFSGPVDRVAWDLITKNDAIKDVVISSLSAGHLRYIRKQSDDVWINVLAFFPHFRFRLAKRIKAASIQPRHSLTRNFVLRARKHNIKVLTWPIHTKHQLKQFFQRGVDMVMSGEEELLNLFDDFKKRGKVAFQDIRIPFWARWGGAIFGFGACGIIAWLLFA